MCVNLLGILLNCRGLRSWISYKLLNDADTAGLGGTLCIEGCCSHFWHQPQAGILGPISTHGYLCKSVCWADLLVKQLTGFKDGIKWRQRGWKERKEGSSGLCSSFLEQPQGSHWLPGVRASTADLNAPSCSKAVDLEERACCSLL